MPRNIQHEVEGLREHVQADWSSAREQRVWARLRHEQLAPSRRRRRAGWALALAGASSLTLISLLAWPDGDTSELRAEAQTGAGEAALAEPVTVERHRLADGSELSVHPDTSYTLGAGRGRDVEIELLAGELEFEVVHDRQRRFRVHAGEVLVEVVGTVFSVERHDHQIAVEVTRGEVRVEAPWRAPVSLRAGERLELERPEPSTAPRPARDPAPPLGHPAAEQPGPSPSVDPAPSPRTPRAKPRDTSWLGLARDGAHESAWSELEDGGFVDRSDPEALMAAADVARLTRHPKAASSWLREVTLHHSSSRLAPLAAFTRGRLLLERLGDPGEAARAFATARTLAPEGPLAEDALAREVEALSKAGKSAEAHELASRYLELYPDGQRRRSVSGWGGLD